MEKISEFVKKWLKRIERIQIWISALPISVFYGYLYRTNKKLLFKGLAISYLIPVILEALPLWWTSPRRLSDRLNERRIDLNYRLNTGRPFGTRDVAIFGGLSVLYALMDAGLAHLKNRLALENRLVIRRLVMERLLYAEIEAFERLRSLDVEYRISADIAQTLNFFSITFPQALETLYAFVRETFLLWEVRARVDPLAILHPVVMLLTRKSLEHLKYQLIEKRQRDALSKTRAKLSRLVSSSMEGLVDIQVNNLQRTQLQLLDGIIDFELRSSHSASTLMAKIWSTFGGRSVPEFMMELVMAQVIMRRQQIGAAQYNRIQYRVDNVVRHGRRLWGVFQIAANMIEFQSEVTALLNLPNFADEHRRLAAPRMQFTELRLRDVYFSYDRADSAALDIKGDLVFTRGRCYAVVGQNRSGKSTLCKILCKLYRPSIGSVALNGIPYAELSRIFLRDMIAYVTQKPYLFPGTVRQNVLVGAPGATEREVFEAAAAAGLFNFARRVSLVPGGSDSKLDKPSAAARAARAMAAALVGSAPNTAQEDAAEGLRRAVSMESVLQAEVGEDVVPMRTGSMRSHADALLAMRVEANGSNVSGGFAQSIALARAFVKKTAQIIILDESMAQMDPYKKREIIYPRLLEYTRNSGKTLILVTHDLVAAQKADRIVVLSKGQIAGNASHAELVRQKCPEYLDLLGDAEK